MAYHDGRSSEAEREKGIYFFARIGAVLSLFAFLSYWYVVSKYSVNAPFWDDYDLLNFLNQFISSKGLSIKLSLLFRQDNEHRIVFSRAVELLDYYLFGKVNFIHLAIAGDVGLVLIVLLLCVYLVKKHVSPLNAAVVVVTLFSFSQYEAMIWASASLQQYYELFFALAALFFFTRSGSRNDFLKGLLLSTMASFTQGGGLIVFPVILVYFVLAKYWKRGWIVLVYGALIFCLYFIILQYHVTPLQAASRVYALHHPLMFLEYFLLFLGNSAPGYGPFPLYVPLLTGIIFLIFAMHMGVRYLSHKGEPFLVFSMLFVLATAVAAGLGRVSWSVKEATASRYSINSLLLFVLIVSYYLVTYGRDRSAFLRLNAVGLVAPLLVFSLWFNGALSDLRYRDFILHRYVVYNPPDPDQGPAILSESERLHTFIPDHVIIATTNHGFLPNAPLPISIPEIASLPGQDCPADLHVDFINEYSAPYRGQGREIVVQSDSIEVKGWAVDRDAHSLASAVLADVDGRLFPLTYGMVRTDVALALKDPVYVYAGFQGSITGPGLRPGKNMLSFVMVNSGETGICRTRPLAIWVSSQK